MITPKPYQDRAITGAIDLLLEGRVQTGLWDTVRGGAGDGGATAYPAPEPRCVLIEAPTGSGKTLMAGAIVERVGAAVPTLWFWFAPFAGVTEQAEAFLRGTFPRLRLRRIATDRQPEAVRPGDVYVTTWGTVAATKEGSRVARTGTESLVPIDAVIAAARAEGYAIGAVVDEAHHGFFKARVAVDFYRHVLRPDFTVLITATPDDADVGRFRAAAGLPAVSRVSVSRDDAVGAGLIKPGVRAVSFAPAPNSDPAQIDFERTALRFGTDLHRAVKQALARAGHGITPLLLVQVDSSDGSVERARETLEDFGFAANAIATHTAAEPDPDVLAVAHDETKEVLIFKMAVALGFDAPRAWTLVSMRRTKDVDFGIQLVGRVLRVDRRLQGRDLPEVLEDGYVVVADPDVQAGLVSAAEQINELQTKIRRAAPTKLTVIELGGAPSASAPATTGSIHEASSAPYSGRRPDAASPGIGSAGEADDSAGTPTWPPSAPGEPSPGPVSDAPAAGAAIITALAGAQVDIFGALGLPAPDRAGGGAVAPGRTAPPGVHRYARRTDVAYPTRLLTEAFPLDDAPITECVAARVRFDDAALNALARDGVAVVRRETDIFDPSETREAAPRTVLADMNVAAVMRAGQSALFGDEFVNGQSLMPALRRRLAAECEVRGMTKWLADEDTLDQGVLRILGGNPALLRQAVRRCLTDYVVAEPAEADVPDALASRERLAPSRLNVYRVTPPGLNTWERQFAAMLDNDSSGTVLWWHRNEPRKPWAVAVCSAETRYNFYPDFVVGLRGRTRVADGVLLVETKHQIKSEDSMAKARSTHKVYGNVMMLTRTELGEWWTVQYDAHRDQIVHGQRFTIASMPSF